MNKTFLIFRYEFLVTIKKAGFIIMTLLMPILVLLTIVVGQAITGIVTSAAKETITIGYVDETGMFSKNTAQGNISLIHYKTIDEAKESLIKNDIS